MEEVWRVLERLVEVGFLSDYAIGGATAAGFHGEPLATRDIDVFVFIEPPAGSLLVSLNPLFARLRDWGFSEFEEEGLQEVKGPSERPLIRKIRLIRGAKNL